MKKIISILLYILLSYGFSYSQCNPYYNFEEGTKWELTSYNAKDKMTGRQVQEIKSLDKTANGWEANIHFQWFDKKDKEGMEKDVEIACEDGVIKMDMERFIPAESLEAFKDMNMTLETENLEWPSNLSVGQQLDDGAINLKGDMFNMSINISDRKVESKETITTPAGTFDCFKVSYTVSTKAIMRTTVSSIDYIAENVGLVKSQNYNQNGKLMAYTVLTSHN